MMVMDEMKKLKAVDEYKGGKGAGNEKLMELQSGQKFRLIRKGGAPAARASEQESETTPVQAPRSVAVTEARCCRQQVPPAARRAAE